MHILVTGGAGYIGSYVTKALLEKGHRVTVVDDLSNGHADAIPTAFPDATTVVFDDICNIRGKYDAIIHLAGSIAVSDPPDRHWTNNVGATLRFLNSIRTGRFIFASSAAVYGMGSDQPLTEDDALFPISAYGQTKVTIEQMLESLGKNWIGGEWTSLRLFNVAGGRERHKNETHLLPLALRGSVTVFGSGEQVRDYVHVEDVADAFVRAIDAPPGIYNIGTSVGTSVMEMIDCVVRVAGRPVTVDYGPERAGDTYSLVANIERAYRDLNWMPLRNLVDIVRSALVDIG